MSFVIRSVAGHYEVLDRFGVFVFSADSYAEAVRELTALGNA